jgi:negative regulator of flagellin synthesis FlgM
MMIGKPTDVGTPQSALRTGSAATRRIDSGAAGDGKVDGVAPSDSVKLSDTGRALTTAGKVIDEFRADKVAAVKMALEQGTYHVQARIVADRMISEAADLLRTMSSSRG